MSLEQFKRISKEMSPEWHHDQAMSLSKHLINSGDGDRGIKLLENHVKMYSNSCSACRERLTRNAGNFKVI